MSDRWRYLLNVHIPGTEASIVRDALEGESFGLRDELGAGELERQIDSFEVAVDRLSQERWDFFESDIQLLSLFLTHDVDGIEICIGEELTGWRIVGHRGEVVRLEIEVARDASGQVGEIGGYVVAALKKRWKDLPDWIKENLRSKHRELDALLD
jgi:hypothetical protein